MAIKSIAETYVPYSDRSAAVSLPSLHLRARRSICACVLRSIRSLVRLRAASGVSARPTGSKMRSSVRTVRRLMRVFYHALRLGNLPNVSHSRNSRTQPASSPHYTGVMAAHPLQALVRHVRRIAGAGDPDPIGDADLVARFARTRDETAFAEIVQRHGPLVWAICRTNLNAADADDAFQATFLVLARKAKSIRKPGSLACWLSGVTRRTVQTVRQRRE